LEVGREAYLWGPHVSECREESSKDVLVHTEDAYAYSGPRHSEDVVNGKGQADEELQLQISE